MLLADETAKVTHWFDVFLGTPLAIVGIIVGGIVARFILHRLIDRIDRGLVSGRAGIGRLEERLPSALVPSSPVLSARREQRARTIASVLKSLTTAAIGAIVGLMVLDQLGVADRPAARERRDRRGRRRLRRPGAGQGHHLRHLHARSRTSTASATSSTSATRAASSRRSGLRVTRLRDVDGTVWYIRNGEVLRVGNQSQGWARAVLDVGVAYGEDVARVEDLLLDVARGLQADADLRPARARGAGDVGRGVGHG